MLPLLLAPVGEANVIKKVSGNPQVKSHLETLGFVPGTEVTVINEIAGNLIVNIKDSRQQGDGSEDNGLVRRGRYENTETGRNRINGNR